MTPSEIAALRALCDAATPGPWRACTWDPMERPHVHKDGVGGHDSCSPRGDLPLTTADAAFIAAARTAVPALLSALEEARRERDGFRNGQDQVQHLFDLLWQDVHGPEGFRIQRNEAQQRAEEAEARALAAEARADALQKEVERLTVLVEKQLEALNAKDDDGSVVLREANEEVAFRRGTDAMLKEALGEVMFSRLWGPELESLGRQMDRLRSESLAAEARADAAWRAGVEAAIGAVESTEDYAFSRAVMMSPADHLACAVSRIRALPPPSATAAPAEEEKCPECGVLNGLHDVRGCSLNGRAPSRGEVG